MASSVILMLLLSSFITIGRTETKNLFREYFSRGMYSCTADYLKTLQELNSFIRRASEQYSTCQKTMDATDKNYPKTQFAPFDELLDSYKKEEDEEKVEGEAVARTSRSTVSKR